MARPKAAPHLLWWQPQAASFVMPLNRVNIVTVNAVLVLHVAACGMAFDSVNIVAVNAILILHVGKTGRRSVGPTPSELHVPSPLRLHVWRN